MSKGLFGKSRSYQIHARRRFSVRDHIERQGVRDKTEIQKHLKVIHDLVSSNPNYNPREYSCF